MSSTMRLGSSPFIQLSGRWPLSLSTSRSHVQRSSRRSFASSPISSSPQLPKHASNVTRPSSRFSSLALRSSPRLLAQQSTTATAPTAAPSPPSTTSPASRATPSPKHQSLTSGLSDEPLIFDEGTEQVDWARSFHGLSAQPFSKEAADTLLQSIQPDDIEVKPDGIIYLPEIKYRRILNKAFGPGGWGMAPRGETIVTSKSVTREYALVAHGRLVSIARGEQDYFSPEGISTAVEGCKSNALMRCCKDLGIASELWDPRFIRKFMANEAKEVFVEHAVTKKKKKIYLRKGDTPKYPFKETKGF